MTTAPIFEHTVGSHSDDRGGDADARCSCQDKPASDHLDNDKEELKRNIMQVVDGFRFDQEWVSHQADDFPDHKGAGCGCGVCQKMKGINESTADSVLTFVDEYTQSKLKAFAGEVEEAIGEKEVSEYKQFDPNDEMILADQLIYDCRNDYRAELRQSLKAIKERWIK